MNLNNVRLIAGGLICALLAGCATTTPHATSNQYDYDQTALKRDQIKTQLQGAGLGAAVGAAIGGIIGHQSGHTWQGAAIGGGVGALVGGAWGTHVAFKKKQFAETESYYRAVIKESRTKNDDLGNEITRLNQELASLRQESAELNSAIARQELQLAEKDRRQVELKRKIAAKSDEVRKYVVFANTEMAINDELLLSDDISRVSGVVEDLKRVNADLAGKKKEMVNLDKELELLSQAAGETN